jgi:hypothetical protein
MQKRSSIPCTKGYTTFSKEAIVKMVQKIFKQGYQQRVNDPSHPLAVTFLQMLLLLLTGPVHFLTRIIVSGASRTERVMFFKSL